MVWAHDKLATFDSKEIVPYINDHGEGGYNSDPEDPEEDFTGHEFENRRSTFSNKLEGIGEVDLFGASLVSLLTKNRPPRESILVLNPDKFEY
jgi:hypothetical protein